MPHRLFVAIRPPEPIRDRLVDTMEGIDNARWQSDEQLHVTLRFIGEVERPQADDLALALARIDAAAFALEIAGVGAFQRSRHLRSRAHAVWAALKPSDALEGLRLKVEQACESAGLARETRRFVPHVTLARIDRSTGPLGTWLMHWGTLAAEPWVVREFVLYESHLGRTGAHYEPVATYPLA
ncbi:MAG: 2'-5' RNA ligase [Sphingomonadales bacterium 32-68-7]|nr:MAG: 2'-5' RNA ligase [Sphingomonadales bacterium 12-68-11]OYX09272.1 MAG: 2'-5' RNA ligase [Sphingomonadales bacterium 32-68-7]